MPIDEKKIDKIVEALRHCNDVAREPLTIFGEDISIVADIIKQLQNPIRYCSCEYKGDAWYIKDMDTGSVNDYLRRLTFFCPVCGGKAGASDE